VTAAISSAGLTKRFGKQLVVDGVDLHVPAGSVYGFLGPNGSGKTTTIRLLLGLVFPTAGTHRLLDRDFAVSAADVLPRVGALVEGPAFHPYLSGRANLARLDAADRRAPAGTAPARIAEALERVGLSAAAGKRYRNYSLGMRQRLGIARCLIADPALLIIRCSKKQCLGKGLNSYTLKVSFSATGPLNLVSAPCVSKGVAQDASGNNFCTDYVQSHRDNAGDLLLYVLFTQDMRGST